MHTDPIDENFELTSATIPPCDFLVIGSGAGGAVAANTLRQAGYDVLVLEEGPYRPASKVAPSATGAFAELWRSAGLTVALGASPVAYAEGCCVGGSTEINSAIFQNPDPSLIAEWAARYNIRDFTADDLAPFFASAALRVNASLTAPPLGPPTELLKRGAEALNWTGDYLERGHAACQGTNHCSFGCPTGAKQSMSTAVLPAYLDTGGRLIARTWVKRLVCENGKAVGAVIRATLCNGEQRSIRIAACKGVILAAGAVHSPALLSRSHLAGLNASTGLRMHPTVKVLAEFEENVDANHFRLPLYAIKQFMPDQRIGGSIITPGTFAMALAESPAERAHLADRMPNTGIYYGMVRAEGTGTITAIPGFKDPIVRYGLTRRDWRALTEILLRTTRAMFAAGAKKVWPSIQGHNGWMNYEAAKTELSDLLTPSLTNLMTIHMFSSLSIGESDVCAFDSYGRSKAVANLWVCDAGQIPEAPGCNPQGMVMALSERTASHLAKTI